MIQLKFEDIAHVYTAGKPPHAWIWGVDLNDKTWHLASHIFDSLKIFVSTTPSGPNAMFDQKKDLKITADVIRNRTYQAKITNMILNQESDSYSERYSYEHS